MTTQKLSARATLILGVALLAGCNSTPPKDTQAPTISLTSSSNNVTSASQITLTATATDNVGVTKVEFYEGSTKLGTDATASDGFKQSVSFTASNNGTHTYTATAYDAAGNKKSSSTNVVVDIDGTKPQVSLTVSPSTLTATGNVTFSASASDDKGVTKVELYDNDVKIGESASAAYTLTKTYAFNDNGKHTITTKAYDAQNNVGTNTATLTVAIADANEPNDSVAAATSMVIGAPSVKAAIAGKDRDYDWYKFEAKVGDQILVRAMTSTRSGSTLDAVVYLVGPDGDVLERADNTDTGQDEEIRYNVLADGTYYLRLTSFDIDNDATAKDDKATNVYDVQVTYR